MFTLPVWAVVNNIRQRGNFGIAYLVKIVDVVADFMVADHRVPQKVGSQHVVNTLFGLPKIREITRDHHEGRGRHIGRGIIDPFTDLLQVIRNGRVRPGIAGVQVRDNDKRECFLSYDLKIGVVGGTLNRAVILECRPHSRPQ